MLRAVSLVFTWALFNVWFYVVLFVGLFPASLYKFHFDLWSTFAGKWKDWWIHQTQHGGLKSNTFNGIYNFLKWMAKIGTDVYNM